jgi:hypothetical protein
LARAFAVDISNRLWLFSGFWPVEIEAMNDYKMEAKLEDGVLHVRVAGQYPYAKLEEPGNIFQRYIEACCVCQCNKVLIDSRELQARFSTIQLFRAGKDAVSLTAAGIWVAMLTRPDLHDPFFEDVVANRGGRIGIFTDMDTARAWLGKFAAGVPKNILPKLADKPVPSRPLKDPFLLRICGFEARR